MTAKALAVTKKADKELSKLPLHIQRNIVRAFDRLIENPLAGERLRGELAAYSKFRVGDYRIVYQFEQKARLVTVVKIEHRQGVYK